MSTTNRPVGAINGVGGTNHSLEWAAPGCFQQIAMLKILFGKQALTCERRIHGVNMMNIVESDVGSFITYNEEVVEPKGSNVVWTKELETGIDILDEQHRHYIDLLNDYCEKATEHTKTFKKTRQLMESFDFLRQYAKEHFSTEESIMTDAEYPDYESHLAEHLHFLKHVEALYQDMKANGFSPELSREVNYYTIEWFIDHILESDMQLVEFIKVKDLKL
jgi:hemerythrin